jgi:general L-amino acid transport system permease protein
MKQDPLSTAPATPWHRDPGVRALIFQALLLLIVVWSLGTIFSNTVTNLENRGIHTGFDFLHEIAPFAIGFSPFIEFKLGESTYWDVFLIGIQNTIIVSFLGIVAATLLGFIIGIMRLSPNWLVSKIASVYIETFRNIPLLLQIMFWNFAIFLPNLPGPRQSLSLGDTVFLNSRGLYMPQPVIQSQVGIWIVIIVSIAAFIGCMLLYRWAKRRKDQTGQSFPVLWVSLAIMTLVPALAYFMTGSPVGAELPELKRFNFEGGMQMPLALFSLWFALSTYTAAFIGETVRGGIMAVDHGQTEAANALGLHRSKVLRLVVIPQALRVIVPPAISQFLNLTKNSSLAVAVAYEELVSIWSGIALNQTGQALVIIAMTIVVYEMLSLMTSAILNFYNYRIQLVEK